jgi:anti-anti-sigma regulatory factor
MNAVIDRPEDHSPAAADTSLADGTDAVTVSAPAELADTRTAETLFARAFAAPAGSLVIIDLSAVTHLTTEAVVPLVALAHHRAALGGGVRVIASVVAHRKLHRLGLGSVLAPQAAG